MHRIYLKNSLDNRGLATTNKHAPTGLKYCNGICQDFRFQSEFSPGKTICRSCINTLNIAKKEIDSGKITLEQFKENPNILNENDENECERECVSESKQCKTCKETKSITQFEKNRAVCKACRALETIVRNSTDLDGLFSDIERYKNNLDKLKNYLESTPKEKLIKVISKYSIGRKATDTKDRMVHNCIEHFRKIQNPKLCKGGCGFELQKEFSMCLGCEKKSKQPNRLQKQIDFENNIDDYVKNLEIIDEKESISLTVKYLHLIANKLNIKLKNTSLKEQIIATINEALKERKESKEKGKGKELIKPSALTLNGLVVEARDSDGYINATALCKAGNKRFNNWYRMDYTNDLISVSEKLTKLNREQLVLITKKHNTWVHPDLAVQLAQWISPEFALRVSCWIREYLTTGTITGNKDEKQLLELQRNFQEKLNEQNKMYKELENKHNKMLLRRKHHKFKEGPCFYIISDKEAEEIKIKVGIDDVDINERLKQHRTSCPAIKLEFLVYTSKNKWLEEGILMRYKSMRKHLNHEWIYNVEASHIVEATRFILTFFSIDYCVEPDIEAYNSQN